MEHESLLNRDDTVLVVVDMQEKLMPAQHDREAVAGAARKLIEGARVLGIPTLASEQYPQGLGPTVAALAEWLGDAERFAKTTFSAAACEPFLDALEDTGRNQVLLCGVETHICVLQTALDLTARGLQVHVVADAVSSRTPFNHQNGLARLAREQVVVTNVESALFELLADAREEAFKRISALIR